MRSYLVLSMCGFFLLQYFFSYPWLQYLVVIMALLAFIGSATKADPFPRWIGIFMMTIGILLEFNKGRGVQGTSLTEGVNVFLTSAVNQSFLLFALALMAIVHIVTYVGIHQIAVISTLAMQLNAQELGISNLALAMLLLLVWSTSTALSPFSGLNLLVSRIAGISGVQVGLRANGLHLSIVILIGIFIISFFR